MGGIWVGTLGPLALGLSIPSPHLQGLDRRAANPPGLCCSSQNPAFTLPASELLLVLFFYLRLLCPRLRIRETTNEPTPMQTHEGLFTSSSLGPSIPDTAEQGFGPPGGFQLSFLQAGLGDFLKGWRNFSSSVYILIWRFQGH